ncbi:MAG: hypothetical protein ACPG45_11820, partial [Flavobacteriaceae bacterium]
QNITIQLDATGNATITTADIDNGSFDNCGITSMTLDSTSFDCSEVGANNVEFIVTDANGNADTCTAIVTVEDIIPINAICQNITVQLDATGNAVIASSDINNGSSDNCSSVTLSLSDTQFDCDDIGANTVVLFANDGNGNTSQCNATVTVADTISPIASCQNITVQLDATGTANITA